MAKLTDFMVSRVRVKLIKIFLSRPQEMFYVRQLTRQTKEEINAVRRELHRLERIGFVKSENRGNRLYYYPNKHYVFFDEFLSLVTKTSGLGHAIRKHRNKIGKIKYAFVSGKFARHFDREANAVDLLVVGTVILPELTHLVKQEELLRQTEINYTIMSHEEFQFRKARRDPFLLSVLSETRIMLIGDEIDMISQKPRETG